MKLTDWYPGDVKPVRVGVYEREYPLSGIGCYCKWDGKMWHSGYENVDRASIEPAISNIQNLPWRGLSKDPKGSE